MKIKIYLTAALLLLSVSLLAEELWRLTKRSNGISVYQRIDPGRSREAFVGITSVDEKAGLIFDAAADISTNSRWMADCIHSELIQRVSESEVIAYYITAPPWPVAKRDSVIRINFSRISGEKFRLRMNSLAEGEAERYVGKTTGMIRIYSMDGFVDLEERNGITDIRFGVEGGPGGNVPEFIVRWGGWRIPYNTLSGLRDFIILKKSQK